MRELKKLFASLIGGILFVLGGTAASGQEILLHSKPGSLNRLASTYGLTVLGRVDKQDLYRVRGSQNNVLGLASKLAQDPQVVNAEFHPKVTLSVPARLDQATQAFLSQSTVSILNQSTVSILNSVVNLSPTTYYGSTVAAGYVAQPAMKIIQNDAAHALSTGIGVFIADINNGVDPNHPALKGALISGFNFLTNSSDVSVFSGMSQSTVSVLNQSTVSVLNQSTVSILNQSTVSVLNQSTVSILNGLPTFFGHGTEVAGILHLVAPQSHIIPLKAFSLDGTGQMFDVIQAIYYAVDHGATVVNMSFSCNCKSKELQRAIDYATDHKVVVVASVGNDNADVRVFPAAYSSAIGVAATSFDDKRAAFSNYGSDVYVSAPGTGIITAFPGGRYSAVWGTSFSAPMVAAEAALLLQRGVEFSKVDDVIAGTALNNSALNPGTPIGHGRIDLLKALQSH